MQKEENMPYSVVTTLFVIISVMLTGCEVFFGGQAIADPEPEPLPVTMSITGTVTNNDISVPVDGNNVLTIETETGEMTVLYMEGGLVMPEVAEQQCNDNDVVNQFAMTLQVGDTVEVLAAPSDIADLEVCSDTRLYIRLIENNGSEPIDNTETRTVSGQIIETINECLVDGDCGYIIVPAEGGLLTVIWSEGDSPNCQNDMFPQDDSIIYIGSQIEAFGYIVDDTTISVCGDDSYYIRLAVDRPETRQVSGTVIEFIGDCAFDGICAYIVETDVGEAITVIWAEGMSPNGQNDMFAQNDGDIVVGDTVDSLGRVVDDVTFSACGDDSYYITKVN